MKKENVILEKSYSFALQVVKTYQYLKNEKKEFELSKSMLSDVGELMKIIGSIQKTMKIKIRNS